MNKNILLGAFTHARSTTDGFLSQIAHCPLQFRLLWRFILGGFKIVLTKKLLRNNMVI